MQHFPVEVKNDGGEQQMTNSHLNSDEGREDIIFGSRRENISKVLNTRLSWLQTCVLPLLKADPFAKLRKSVPSREVRITLRLVIGLTCGKTWSAGMLCLQRVSKAGTAVARDGGTSQSYTVGWLISSCSPETQRSYRHTHIYQLLATSFSPQCLLPIII